MKKGFGKNLLLLATSGTTITLASLYGVSQTSPKKNDTMPTVIPTPENNDCAQVREQLVSKNDEIILLKKKYSNNDLIVEELNRQIESLITKINDLKKQLKDKEVELQMEKNWSEQLESNIEKLEDYITKLDEWAESLHDMFTNFTKL